MGSYAIGQGSLKANDNYTISFTGSSLTITPATLSVTADAQSKVYGDDDPALTFHISTGNLVGSDAFSGRINPGRRAERQLLRHRPGFPDAEHQLHLDLCRRQSEHHGASHRRHR